MLQPFTYFLRFSLISLLIAQVPLAGEDAAWNAAMARKQKSADLEAAAGFAKFNADFPQSNHALMSAVEEGVCWFSAGRGAQVLNRNTPESKQRFDKAFALFQGVTKDHPSAPEAARACYMQGSVHFFQGQLELADADFSGVFDKFSIDKNYVGKSLLQRAMVRRGLMRSKEAIVDLQRWVKEVGAPPEQLTRTSAELERALLLDKQAPVYGAESWFNGEPAPLELQSGNVVALYFFATWCPNCAAELPFVLDLEKRFAPLGVRFIGVTDHSSPGGTVPAQTPESIRKHLAEHHIGFSVFQDNGQTSVVYKVTTIPMLALIDRGGVLRWCDKPSTVADWTIEKLLSEGLEPAKKSEQK